MWQRDAVQTVHREWLSAAASDRTIAYPIYAERLETLGVENVDLVLPDAVETRSQIAAPLTTKEVDGLGAARARGGPRAEVRCMADVEPESIAWVWDGRIARGKLAILAGEPGVGKSTIAQAIAAAVSAGRPLPGDAAREPAAVLILSAEESAGDTVRPRLARMSADLERVFVVDGIRDGHGVRLVSLSDSSDLDTLESLITDHGAALVIIDVLQAFLGSGVDMHRANEIRAVMAPLAALAERTGAAFLILCHTNKAASSTVSARVLGSIDIVAAVRCVLIAGRDPDAPDDAQRGVIARGKSNLPGLPPPVAYLLDGGLSWGEERRDATAERILAPRAPEGGAKPRDDAADFLRQDLAGGPRPAEDVIRDAAKQCITARTLQRAKRALGVQSVKRGFTGDARWFWRLPEGGHDDAEVVHPDTVAVFDGVALFDGAEDVHREASDTPVVS